MKTKRPLPKRFSGTIRVSGILVGVIAVLLSAASVAMAAPFAYVSSFSQDRVTVVDGTPSRRLPPPRARRTGACGGIVVVGSSVFVADFGSGSVLAINVTTGVIAPLPLSFSMFGIAATSGGPRVYVPYGKINLNQEYDLEVAVIDPSGPVIVASVPVGTL